MGAIGSPVRVTSSSCEAAASMVPMIARTLKMASLATAMGLIRAVGVPEIT
jgi:hypothetical protein